MCFGAPQAATNEKKGETRKKKKKRSYVTCVRKSPGSCSLFLSLSPTVWSEHPREPRDSTRHRQYYRRTCSTTHVHECVRQYETATLRREFGISGVVPFRRSIFHERLKALFRSLTRKKQRSYRPAVSLTTVVDAAGALRSFEKRFYGLRSRVSSVFVRSMPLGRRRWPRFFCSGRRPRRDTRVARRPARRGRRHPDGISVGSSHRGVQALR